MTQFSRASSLARFDEFAAKNGLDYQQMLELAGLPADVLGHPESLIPYQRVEILMDLCASESGNPLFGLEYGLFQGVDIFGPLLYLLKNAQTVQESLIELTHFYHLHSSGALVTIEQHGSLVVLSYKPTLESEATGRQAIELAIGVGKQLLHALFGKGWQPNAVYLQSAPGADLADYRRLLGLVPQFNSETNSCVFDAALLRAPLSESDPVLHSLMRQHMEKLDRMSLKELPAYVQHLISSFLPNGRVTVEQVADYMMLSRRTLQRHLAEEETSFQQLLENTRKTMATRYLRESDVSLTQLSGMLGYGDLVAFSRAFHRWTGKSPRQWRKDEGIDASSRRLITRRKMPAWVKG
ncbi:AraC family transcriptional regulator [Marinobacter sp.]|uniref:AraC family transcriptional regulator n=1 Tax=Marinobacter sp. TaxID=50741 RepID=UPI001B5E1EE6|nr:AraC family transcriptional regulator [Marinobacter sp.]MBQ0833497.1 AraC family transcriptional regulator [Marinobacter sp.]